MRHHRRRFLGAAFAALFAGIALSAQTGRKVSGTVVSAVTQQPVVNAGVRYEESGQQPQTTATDSKGYFEFRAPGRLGVVTVNAKGFGTARRRWPPASSSTLLVELMPPAVLRGTVSDLVTGRPVSAVLNVLVQHPGNFVSRTAIAEKGAFEVGDLPSGTALITARSLGFAPFVGSTNVEAGKVRDVQVGLLLEAQAEGQVRDSGGDAVAGAVVTAAYPELGGAGLVEDFVGGVPLSRPDGVFALDGLVPNTTIALQAELGGRRSEVETISITPGTKRSGIVLTLP